MKSFQTLNQKVSIGVRQNDQSKNVCAIPQIKKKIFKRIMTHRVYGINIKRMIKHFFL